MIDRLVHHAEILSLKGDSYRLKDRDLARATPAEDLTPTAIALLAKLHPRQRRAGGISLRSPTARSAKSRRMPRHHVVYFSTGATLPKGGAFSTGAKGCDFARP